MKNLISLALVVLFASQAAAQFPYAEISWPKPKSPTTNNVLLPATFHLNAVLVQGARRWPHGFWDSTDYGREYLFWANLGTDFKTRVPWRVSYNVDAFLAEDPLNGNLWVVYSDYGTLYHGAGAGGVSGRITWRYFR